MLASLISILLLAIAVYLLIKSKPNLFLFELMQELMAKKNDTYSDQNKKFPK
jgi:hypothetical protein